MIKQKLEETLTPSMFTEEEEEGEEGDRFQSSFLFFLSMMMTMTWWKIQIKEKTTMR